MLFVEFGTCQPEFDSCQCLVICLASLCRGGGRPGDGGYQTVTVRLRRPIGFGPRLNMFFPFRNKHTFFTSSFLYGFDFFAPNNKRVEFQRLRIFSGIPMT